MLPPSFLEQPLLATPVEDNTLLLTMPWQVREADSDRRRFATSLR